MLDGGPQVVDDDCFRHAAEMPESILQGADEVVGRLPERGLAVSLAAMAQHNPEDVRLAALAIGTNGLFNASVLQQQTINRSTSFSGVGLHSGNRVTMTFLPAPPNTGIRFRRVDLEGKPEIEARVEHVAENNRSTTLAKGNTRIHTVEHVLATFAGYGIDNAIVELDSNEPPVGDGSAREYCKLVQSAGIVAQDERREAYHVTTPIEFAFRKPDALPSYKIQFFSLWLVGLLCWYMVGRFVDDLIQWRRSGALPRKHWGDLMFALIAFPSAILLAGAFTFDRVGRDRAATSLAVSSSLWLVLTAAAFVFRVVQVIKQRRRPVTA